MTARPRTKAVQQSKVVEVAAATKELAVGEKEAEAEALPAVVAAVSQAAAVVVRRQEAAAVVAPEPRRLVLAMRAVALRKREHQVHLERQTEEEEEGGRHESSRDADERTWASGRRRIEDEDGKAAGIRRH